MERRAGEPGVVWSLGWDSSAVVSWEEMWVQWEVKAGENSWDEQGRSGVQELDLSSI